MHYWGVGVHAFTDRVHINEVWRPLLCVISEPPCTGRVSDQLQGMSLGRVLDILMWLISNK